MPRIASVVALALVATLGCSSTTAPIEPVDLRVTVTNPPLTLNAHDFPASLGVFWIQATAEGGKGVVTARGVRYGSLCMLAVGGHAEITGSRVDLHVSFAPRTSAVCTKEIRAIEYDAEIGPVAPGRYEVHLFQVDDDVAIEVRVQTLDVT